MSEGELKMGDGLLLKSFTDHVSDTAQLSYKNPGKTKDGKPRYHLALWLGIWDESALDVDTRLNALGWVYNPKRAAETLAEREKGERG